MQLYKYLLSLLIVSSALFNQLHAIDHRDISPNDSNTTEHMQNLNDRDLASLRDFLRSKRHMDLLDKITHLSFSGDMRAEWRHITEKICGTKLRGSGFSDDDNVPYGKNDFDIEFNFLVEYETDRTWAVAHIDYDNAAGIDRVCCCCCDDAPENADSKCVGTCPEAKEEMREICECEHNPKRRFHGSGSEDGLDLKRCYMGYEVYADHCTTVDIELGRRKMYDVFESDIQFNSRFDSLVVEAGTKLENIGKIYVKGAGFVVDERINHFAWAAEIGMLNILDTGLDFKYSLVDWQKHGKDRCDQDLWDAFRYFNSQGILTYNIDKCWLKRPAAVYSAALWNHAAKNQSTTKPLGWYAGVIVGEVEKEGDWAIELEYQWVGEEAVSYDDQNGIGLGDLLANYCGGPGPTPGFKGWQLDTLYALTDNITIDTTLQWTRSNEAIKHDFSQLQVEAVYAF